VTQIPAHAEPIDPIALKTRELIEDAERAVATHHGDLAEFARQTLMGRAQRNRYFDPVLFSNPAWDILLNLYVAAAEGRALDVLDCCSTSAVPQGVALYWLSYLKQEEMIVEIPAAARPRQTLISLSDQAQTAISAYLGSLICLGLGPNALMPVTPSAAN